MKKELHDGRSIAMEVMLQVNNGLVALLPNCFSFARDALCTKDFRMYADDKHFLVVGPIEDTDPSALGQVSRRPPQKIVLQLLCARMLKTEDLTPLGIDAGHDVL